MLFIVNNTAGSGKAQKDFAVVKNILCERNTQYSVAYTEYKGHATEIAMSAAKAGEKLIVAVGGDGTVREVSAALIGTDCIMGILPFGTGNDMAKPLNIPLQPVDAILNVLAGNVRRMDMCRANDQFLSNVAGIGFDVDVLVETERFKEKFTGMMLYLLGVLNAAFRKRPMKMRITMDNTVIEGSFLMINIANGTHIGGGMKVAPCADPFDGLFDVMLIKYVGLFKFACLLPGFIKGKHIKYKKTVQMHRARYVKVEPLDGDEFPVQTDGEIDVVTPCTFEVMQSALNIIVPKEQL